MSSKFDNSMWAESVCAAKIGCAACVLICACIVAGSFGEGPGLHWTRLAHQPLVAFVNFDMQEEMKATAGQLQSKSDAEKQESNRAPDPATKDRPAASDPKMKDSPDPQKPKVKFNLGKRSEKAVLRAKRPKFDLADTDKIFFDDFFSEALVGPQPDWSARAAAGSSNNTIPSSGATGAESSSGKLFDDLISAAVIEDEIKRTTTLLTTQITTPGRFKAEYGVTHQYYSQLATLFAINEAYGKEIRWHDDAPAFRANLGKTAAGTRVGSQQAYQIATRSREDLLQVVRGGRSSLDAPDEAFEDWSTVVDRTPMMVWLNALSLEQLRLWTSDEVTIKRNKDAISRNAEVVAAISQVLLMPEMDDYSDEGYRGHSAAMKAAALDIKSSLRLENYSGVQAAVNQLTQSCDNCHEDFR